MNADSSDADPAGASGRPAHPSVPPTDAALAAIIDIASDAIISIDEQQRVTVFNKGAEQIFGYPREAMLGRSIDLLVPEAVRSRHHGQVARFAAGPDAARRMGERTIDIAGRRRNGEIFPAEAAISKLEVGGRTMLTVVLRDVTLRRRQERADRLMAELGGLVTASLDHDETLAGITRMVLRELGDFVLVHLVEGDRVWRAKVAHADPGKTELVERLERFELARDRPHIGHEVLDSLQPLLVAEVLPQYLESLAQSPQHLALLRELAVGSLMAAPLQVHQRLVGALIVVSSTATRRYGEAELDLLVQVAARAAYAIDNAGLYAAACRATEARDEVLGIVAHDLRNPIHTIQLASGLLRDVCAHGVREDKLLSTISRASERASRLIEDLLDASRMDAGGLSIRREPLAVSALVRDVVEAQQTLAASAGVELSSSIAPELPDVAVDPDRVMQLFQNLIGNAVKFTPTGGQVRVEAGWQHGVVAFRVVDTGPGIAAADLPHVFDRFWQAKDARRRGTGLGLAIVKGIVEGHGGTIWVESELGVGTTFGFTLPVVDGARRAPESDGAERGAARVLVVDDDRASREGLAGLLADEGFVVETAPSARAALAELDRFIPAVLVADMDLPDMDGIALAEESRARIGGLPVILVSGQAAGHERIRAAPSALPTSLVAKPVDARELLDGIRRAVRTRR